MSLKQDLISVIERRITLPGKRKKLFAFAISSFALLFLIIIVSLVTFQINILKRKVRKIEKIFPFYKDEMAEFLPILGNITIPKELQTVPLAEKMGVVLGTRSVSIRNVQAPYNPSMVEFGKGYLLVFRYDVVNHQSPFGFYSRIGLCKLNADFTQTEEEFRTIDTGSKYSEDPRLFEIGDEYYLLFNDLDEGNSNGRTMHIGKLNLETAKLEFATRLDLAISHVEKNWVPFEYLENGKPEIYLEYYPNPHKILKLPDPKSNNLIHLQYSEVPSYIKYFWPSMYGRAKGGSVARIVDGQYLGFLHSFIHDNRNPNRVFYWYIMGAYTFEKEPPFRVTSVSHYPILFEGIYESPHMNTSDLQKRVIFPGSFTEGTRDGKEVLYLCCGENDSAIKIITIDKHDLLKNMKQLQ